LVETTVKAVPHCRAWLVLVVVGLTGCGKPSPSFIPRAETGAEKTAQGFFEALVSEDWPRAYAALDPESQAWCSEKKFAELAQHYREQIGFTPTGVSIGANEIGDTATAIANFKGLSGTTIKQSKDGTALRRTAGGWAVVLRENFGKDSPKSASGSKGAGKARN
jgi:hypothetical protein